MTKREIYCRLSEEDRNKQNAGDDSGSIQNRKTMLRDYCTDLTAERNRLRERVLMLEGKAEELTRLLDEDEADRDRRIKACIDGCGARRETVEGLIDCILVGTRIPGTRTIPLEIHWNF